MKYTAGELRKMNGRKCKLQYGDKSDAEWEIYVVDWSVNFVTNNDNCKEWIWTKKYWYEFSWKLYWESDNDRDYTVQYDSITFLDEPHQNIYYDDNGEIIKEWDWVLVGGRRWKRIFLCKVPRKLSGYCCVENWFEDMYINTSGEVPVVYREDCIKYKEPEKKLRELMLTDEEYEEVTKKYK